MKKILLTILALINLAQMPLALAAPLILAEPLDNQDLMTRVILDDSYKPPNSPGVVFGENELKKAGAESAFGNYLLQMLAGGLITLAAPIAIIIIAAAGLMAVVSHGNQGTIDKAKKTLTWAIIGLVIIIFSWIIVRAALTLVISTNQNQPASSATNNTNQSSPAPVNNASQPFAS